MRRESVRSAIFTFRWRQHRTWQRNVDRAANMAVRQQQQRALWAELEQALTPPAPPPEPQTETIIVEQPDDKDRPVEVHRWFTRS